jgi:RNA-directed DNA polymerase
MVQLPASPLHAVKTISKLLSVSEKGLWRIYFLVRRNRGYTQFEIPKRSGGARRIHKPIDDLFYVQGQIKSLILDNAPEPPDCVTAFRRGLSIRDHALVHCDKMVLVKLDLKDFFPSVSFTRVWGIFEDLGLSPRDARLLAYLATIESDLASPSPITQLKLQNNKFTSIAKSAIRKLYAGVEEMYKYSKSDDYDTFSDIADSAFLQKRYAKELEARAKPRVLKRRGLPQGAPTSPQLANLAARRLDARLLGLAASMGFQYTRYADDLTFSTTDHRGKVNVLKWSVEQIVNDCGFTLNAEKTTVMRAPATRLTTGLIVNGSEPRVRRSTIRLVRAMLHQQSIGKLPDDEIAKLNGYMSFIQMVNPEQARKLLNEPDSSV